MTLMQDRVGQQFGNYLLTHLIGQGGFAEVYLAQHIHLPNLQHAIKVLSGTQLHIAQQEAFLLEARTIANLQGLNNHIVQIRDFGIEDESIPYIVMEYAAEGTMRTLYPHGTKAPLGQIVFYVKQVAEALQCAHDQTPPIVHRDVKPENMLLRSKDHLLLSDFGIATTSMTGPLLPSEHSIVVGSASYIAPERLKGFTRRASDQYSLGIVVYEWICGSCPFDGNVREIQLGHAAFPPPPLQSSRSDVTLEIEHVVMRALAKQPEERYPNVQAFASALEAALLISLRWQKGISQATIHGIAVQQTVLHIPTILVQTPIHLPDTIPNHQITRPLRPNTSIAAGKQYDFFAFSSHFSSIQRDTLFRWCGIVLNGLTTLFIIITLKNPLLSIGGGLFALLMFTLCIFAVDARLARFFGVVVAVYWGTIGWTLGDFLSPLLHLSGILFTLFLGILFLGTSFAIHMRYVTRKYI